MAMGLEIKSEVHLGYLKHYSQKQHVRIVKSVSEKFPKGTSVDMKYFKKGKKIAEKSAEPISDYLDEQVEVSIS